MSASAATSDVTARTQDPLAWINIPLARFTMKGKSRLDFYYQLATLSRAGKGTPDALAIIHAAESWKGAKPSKPMAIAIGDMISRLRNGQSRVDAMAPWMPAEDATMLAAAEPTRENAFAKILDEYCSIIEEKAQTRGKIYKQLAYPALLLFSLLGVLWFFAISILPEFARLLPAERWTGMADLMNRMTMWSITIVPWVLFGLLLVVTAMVFSLPRWATRPGWVDRLPFYSAYRQYTGITFLLSLGTMLNAGMAPRPALDIIRRKSTSYQRHHVDLIETQMRAGKGIGAAFGAADTHWPDAKLNITLDALAQSTDLSIVLMKLSRDWLPVVGNKIVRQLQTVSGVLFIFLTLVLGIIINGFFSLQQQVATGFI